jgi:bifunctional DNA-binding transcriptional regulator/antitoxin component of YhaV-PrlF toxin-antitoxin module
MAGYSGTPLAQKLGIKPGQRVATIEAPKGYRALLVPLPEGVSFTREVAADALFVHLFVKERQTLEKELKRLRRLLADTGVLWVSWPKKSSGVKTDITEDVIRTVCLPLGFVDVKVCAVDETWSGLKLMIRRENRL